MIPGLLLDNRWRVGEPAGEGGFGVVYRGEDLHGGQVAIKVYLADGDRRGGEHRRRELESLAAMDLPGVVPFIGYGTWQGAAYLVTRWVEGQPFGAKVLPVEVVARVVLRVLRALRRLHVVARVVHGDLKPENVLVDADDRPWILDLGTARGLDEEDAVIVASERWAAPEVLFGEPPGPASDLYAVGLLAWIALVGVDALPCANRRELYEGRARPGSPEAPPAWEGHPLIVVLQSLLRQLPEARPSIDEAIDALSRCVQGPMLEFERWLGEPRDSPVEAAELLPWIAGVDRLLHRRARAADLIVRRTGGDPAAIASLLHAWVDDGLATWEGQHLRLLPNTLARAEASLEPMGRPLRLAQVSEVERHVLAALEVGGEATRLRDLEQWLVLPAPQAGLVSAQDGALEEFVPFEDLQEVLDALMARGFVRRCQDGRHLPCVEWTAGGPDRRTLEEWHLRLARLSGAAVEVQLRHLLAAGAPDLIEAVVPRVLTLAQRGSVALALGWLERIAERARREQRPDRRVLALAALRVALETPTKDTLSDALRVAHRCDAVDLAELPAITLIADPEQQTRAWEALTVSPSDPEADVVVRLRALASFRRGQEHHERELAYLAARFGDLPGLAALRHDMEGRAAYGAGRFGDAADVFRASRALSSELSAQVRLLLSEAAAACEIPDLERARACAQAAASLSEQTSYDWGRVRAEQHLRWVVYRAGEATSPDADLVQEVREVGWTYLAGMLAVTEAAVAAREGDFPLALELARFAAISVEGQSPGIHLLADALVAHLLGDRERGQRIRERVARLDLPFAAALQIRALAGERGVPPEVGALDLGRRREVLSLGEALDLFISGRSPFTDRGARAN
jgi:hypothetical protein